MRYFFPLLIVLTFSSVAMAMGGYRDNSGKEFQSQPLSEQNKPEESVCISCHISEIMKPEFRNIPQEWKSSWHSQNDVSCHDCHGGDSRDASMAMSPQRGFVGIPGYDEVPDFCGKCHIGILKHYLESGHGKALKTSGSGPNCVVCHSAHDIQKASIDIINEQRCTQCHSYERARIIKQALFITENKINSIDRDLKELKARGVFTEEEDKNFFNIHAEFRSIFHSVDVSLIKEKTDDYTKRLDLIEGRLKNIFNELEFRRNFSAFLMLVFAGMGIILFLLIKSKSG
ncbi:MAG: multiheme c-type cytochrome [Nitrospirota bacterium]